jgi:hypothetical protein
MTGGALQGRPFSFLLHDPVPEVCHRRGIDHPVELQPDFRAAEIVEQSNAAAEEHRDEVDLELVEQSGP